MGCRCVINLIFGKKTARQEQETVIQSVKSEPNEKQIFDQTSGEQKQNTNYVENTPLPIIDEKENKQQMSCSNSFQEQIKKELNKLSEQQLQQNTVTKSVLYLFNQFVRLNDKQIPGVSQSCQSMNKLSILNINIKGPELFVRLKKGSINDFYDFQTQIGEGAYGSVFKAIHKTTGIIRALKKLKKDYLVKEDEQQFFAELQILKNLDHPNIVKLHELYQDEIYYYLVTEFCSGGELFEKIKQLQTFSERTAAEYLKQILSAIAYCHEKNIVHRDIKPENIIFDTVDQNSSLKIIDFGTARRFDPAKKMTKLLGTAYYMAPEVILQKYNHKCDVWSIGIILYIMLCGYPPFRGINQAEILKKVQQGKVEFDPADWDGISESAKVLIKKMLTYHSYKRISAKDALNDVWIQGNSYEVPFDQKIFLNLAKFNSCNKFKTAILAFIATQIITNQEVQELTKAFQRIDTDGDGTLSKEELIQGYAKFCGNYQLAVDQAETLIQEIDYNNSGKIDYSEFLVASINKEKLLTQQKIDHAFRLFDQDNNGFIDQEECKEVLGDLINDERWQTILEEYDTNDDGKLSKDEFISMIMDNVDSFVIKDMNPLENNTGQLDTPVDVSLNQFCSADNLQKKK